MSTKAKTVFYSTGTCTLLPNTQLFMYPMDSDVSLYNLHTICYSSELEEPLIHDDEDKRARANCRHSILHALLFVVL